MSETNEHGARIAAVGSPSSNYEVTLDVTGSAFATPIVGAVVYLENPMGEGSELALGTVTEVVTTNKWHEDPSFRGLIRSAGEIRGMSGDDGDVRQASIRVQAAWRRDNPGCPWEQTGPNLRMSPATGTPVRQVNGTIVAALTETSDDIAYMGHLGGAESIPLPLAIPDFSSSLGAFSTGVYGLTGSGKALALGTPIPTPSGWTTMGELTVGDQVYDETGAPTTVTGAFDVQYDRPCFTVTFADGTVIVADGEHLWPVTLDGSPAGTVTTEELRSSLLSGWADVPQYDGSAITPAGQALQHQVTSIVTAPSVPVRCIRVAAASHLFLAGTGYVPTHNTQAVAMLLATQMRHEQHGMVIIDPQGQWASEQGMVFSVQGWAAELGRDVIVRRISEDLRLSKDAPLMTSLLKHTALVIELGLKHESTEDIVWYEMTKAMRQRDDWTADSSDVLLRAILEHLASDGPANKVYTTPDNAARFQQRVNDVLNDPGLFTAALHQFSPIHNLFQSTNPSGGARHDLNATLTSVFTRIAGQPASLLILDMSSKPMPGMDDEVEEASERAYEILEKDVVKAAVLRNLFHTLKRASEARFRTGENLNTLVVLDEAWRYAAPPGKVDEEEIALLSKDLAGYARDTRKFGIGWLYISQSTRSVNLDIWDQMTVRLFGYGLNGADLDKMGEVVDDRSALRLYRSNGNPRSTGVYPFMLTGPVSPLAANSTPVMLHVYTDFQTFRDDNDRWIRPIRQRLGLPVETGTPKGGPRKPGVPKPRTGQVKDPRRAIVDTNKAVRENRRASGVTDTAGFADPFAAMDDTSF
jgi:hypothetical protein